MDRPVYLFSGFLDAGKTTAVMDSLYDRNFNFHDSNLILVFEQGDEEYTDDFLNDTGSQVVYYESLDDLTEDEMIKLERMYDPDRIIMELNGMEDESRLYQKGALLPNWIIAQSLTFFDGTTLRMYMNNMKQFVYNHIVNSEEVIINRCRKEDVLFFRSNMKAINPRIMTLFMDDDYNVMQNISEQLFDVSKPLNITDEDFGLWYTDALDNPEKYNNVHIVLKMQLQDVIREYENVCTMGRKAMVCCSNDIQNFGITCVNVDPLTIIPGEYYYISGTLKNLKDEEGMTTCVLYSDGVKKAEKPDVELVTFN